MAGIGFELKKETVWLDATNDIQNNIKIILEVCSGESK